MSNPTPTFHKEIDELVRDLTKVGSIPKSEARRRINALILSALSAVQEFVDMKKKEHCGQKDCGQGQCQTRATRNKALSCVSEHITELKKRV